MKTPASEKGSGGFQTVGKLLTNRDFSEHMQRKAATPTGTMLEQLCA